MKSFCHSELPKTESVIDRKTQLVTRLDRRYFVNFRPFRALGLLSSVIPGGVLQCSYVTIAGENAITIYSRAKETRSTESAGNEFSAVRRKQGPTTFFLSRQLDRMATRSIIKIRSRKYSCQSSKMKRYFHNCDSSSVCDTYRSPKRAFAFKGTQFSRKVLSHSPSSRQYLTPVPHLLPASSRASAFRLKYINFPIFFPEMYKF